MQLQVFSNPSFGYLSVLVEDGREYFPATECAAMLGYVNPKDAIIRHCKGVVKRDLPTEGGTQTKNFIPEGDLFRIIIRSKLPVAQQIESWIFDEVLPAIRKTGSYGGDNQRLFDEIAELRKDVAALRAIPRVRRQITQGVVDSYEDLEDCIAVWARTGPLWVCIDMVLDGLGISLRDQRMRRRTANALRSNGYVDVALHAFKGKKSRAWRKVI